MKQFFPYILVLFWLCVGYISSWNMSATIDEPVDIAIGYYILKTGDFNVSQSHPPLSRLLNGVILLPFQLTIPDTDIYSEQIPLSHQINLKKAYIASAKFFFNNKVSYIKLLRVIKIVRSFLAGLLAILLFQFSKGLFGYLGGIISLVSLIFMPILTGHMTLATSDMAVTLAIFLTYYFFYRWLKFKKKREWIWCGVMLGISFLTKHSALLLLPALFVLYFSQFRKSRPPLKEFIGILILAFFIIHLGYGFREKIFNHTLHPEDWEYLGVSKDNPLQMVYAYLPLPDSYIKSIVFQMMVARSEIPYYFKGQLLYRNVFSFYPAVILARTPPVMIFSLPIAIFLIWKKRRDALIHLIFPTIFFIVTIISALSGSFRYLFPIYPFWSLLLGGVGMISGINPFLKRGFLSILFLSTLYEWALCFPYFLTYYSPIFGGYERGWKYMNDDMDWGQNEIYLSRWQKENNIKNLYALPYGWATYYGVKFESLTPEILERPDDKIISISVRYLVQRVLPYISNKYDNYSKYLRQYDWLANPDYKIGRAVFIYDFRNKKDK